MIPGSSYDHSMENSSSSDFDSTDEDDETDMTQTHVTGEGRPVRLGTPDYNISPLLDPQFRL